MFNRTTIFRDAEGAAGGAQGAAAAAAGAPAAGSGAPAGDLASFLGGMNPDVRALVQTKGWDKDATGAAQVLERMAQGYTGLEKTVGLDKVALPPVGADGKRDWSKFDAKALGRPDEPTGYSVFKAAEGQTVSPADKETHAAIGALMHKAGIADWQAEIVGKGLAEMQAGREGKSAETKAAETAATEAALRGKWGTAYDSKLHAANLAMSKMPEGIAAKVVAAGLGRDAGYLEFLAQVGAGISEDGTVGEIGSAKGGGAGARTPAEAQAEINRLMADETHLKILGNKDHLEYRAANDRMARLYAEAYPEEQQR